MCCEAVSAVCCCLSVFIISTYLCVWGWVCVLNLSHVIIPSYFHIWALNAGKTQWPGKNWDRLCAVSLCVFSLFRRSLFFLADRRNPFAVPLQISADHQPHNPAGQTHTVPLTIETKQSDLTLYWIDIWTLNCDRVTYICGKAWTSIKLNEQNKFLIILHYFFCSSVCNKWGYFHVQCFPGQFQLCSVQFCLHSSTQS